MFSHTSMTSDSLGQLLAYWTSLKDGPNNRLTKDERQCLLFLKVVSVPQHFTECHSHLCHKVRQN
jgi:hypothetical protein